MTHEKLNEFLQRHISFQVEIGTTTNVSAMGKILLGVNSATDIKTGLPTFTKYSYRENGLFTASYNVGDEVLTGLGVIDEWREIASEKPFNVYGFDYDPDFREFEFRMSTIKADTDEMQPVGYTRLLEAEKKILANLCLNRALGNLSVNQQLLVLQ